MSDYAQFLESKTQLDHAGGFDPVWMPDYLFDFQEMLTTWAIRQGRAALFADCGMGKTPMALVWAHNVYQHTGKPVLIVTPLAVSFQVEQEAHKFNVGAAVSRDGSIPAPVTITNYERLEKFDSTKFGGVVCDESSAIKSFDGTRRAVVTEFLRLIQYRLLCTATAAPNDYVELGTSSEALGHLGHMDMLQRFFTNRDGHSNNRLMHRRKGSGGRKGSGAQAWRFKGHAEDAFWRWVSSWARAIRKPSDYGFSDDGFNLPPLEHRQHVVEARQTRPDVLFDLPASGLQEEREETRRTLTERCEWASEVISDAESAVMWCHLNDESALLAKLTPGAVELSGSDSPEAKEDKLLAFSRGEIRTLVTKPKIGVWGLNWQHCHRMTYFPSHSYEQYYQAIRRCWRYGQTRPVVVDVVTTPGGANTLANLQRKANQAERMFDSLIAHMTHAIDIQATTNYPTQTEVPSWVMS